MVACSGLTLLVSSIKPRQAKHMKPRLKSEPFRTNVINVWVLLFHPIAILSHSQLIHPPSPSSISSLFMPFKATRSQEHSTSPNLPKGRPWTTCRTSLVPLTTKHVWQHGQNTRNIKKSSSNKHELCKPRTFEVKGFLEDCAAHTA